MLVTLVGKTGRADGMACAIYFPIFTASGKQVTVEDRQCCETGSLEFYKPMVNPKMKKRDIAYSANAMKILKRPGPVPA